MLTRRLLRRLALLLTMATACAQERPAEEAGPAWLVLAGALVYPSPADPPIDDGVVVVRQGQIAEVGSRRRYQPRPGATVIDCTGQTLTAGFWNSHVHFTEPRWQQAATAYTLSDELRQMLVGHGFLSVVDAGSYLSITSALRRRIETGEVAGPRILTAGEILFPKGGAPPREALKGIDLAGGEMPEIGTPEEAAARTRQKLDQHVDAVKLYVATWWNDPPARLAVEIVRAAADEAHGRGKPVLAHPSDITGIETAISGGVDVIMHTTPAAGPWPGSLVGRMRQHGVALIPTLKLWRAELLREGLPEAQGKAFQRVAVGQLAAYVRAGGEVLFGTDVGYMKDDDPREEYDLMAQAGMDYRQILASLTTAPAARFGGGKQSGRIAAGEAADLVLLDGDPAADIAAFTRIACVVRGGRILYTRRRR